MDQEKHVIEYTSGQLIFAICIALVVALLCFLGGMIAKPQTQTASAPPADTPKAAAPAQKTTAAPAIGAKEAGARKEGQQTLPKPSVLSSVKPNTSKPAASPSEGGPRAVELPPLDANPASKATPAAPAPKSAAEPPKTVPPAPAAAAPASPAPPTQSEKTKATESQKKEVASQPPDKAQSPIAQAKEDTPAPKSPEKTVAPSAAGKSPAAATESTAATGYTIQLVAFSPAEAAKAEDYKSRLEKNTDLRPEVIKSTDGKYVRVVTGAYPDRATAEKAREALAKRAEFAKCFVRKRN
ncbi:MAG: SPOR domain-containing protein [Candidatus Hydrogenedentes bacterium]|nr:SPOR domain-containing protein [Candidatus Hydrogenedentota bacterium]